MDQAWPFTANRGRGRRSGEWGEKKKARFRDEWNAGTGIEAMTDMFETSRGAIYQRARTDPQCEPRRRRVARPLKNRIGKAGRDRTSQRRFTGATVEEGHKPKIVLEAHHPAHRLATTVFPRSVIPAARMARLLKSGEHSRKIGAVVAKGPWRGFPIFTLTLVERETCPRTCLEWSTCYGNNMHMAQRIHDDGTLTKRLWGELAALSAQHPAGFLVRLHVLGDFFDRDYVRFWREALSDFPPLRVFGFTARRQGDIARDLMELALEQPDRFVMRFSGGGYDTDCSEVVDTADQATGILCPAQRDPDRSCATCCLCWHTNRTISFLRH